MDMLGEMYAAGDGVGQNDATAARLFRLASAQRDAGGFYDWAVALLENKAFIEQASGDAALAPHCTLLNAATDVAPVANTPAQELYAGDPAALRPAGVRYLRLSANAGEVRAYLKLGSLYETGADGVVQNYGEAARWYARAAASGNPEAKRRLDSLHASGKIP
jgi:TPR repeat protein